MMDEGLLRLVAAELAYAVTRYGNSRGFYEANLRDRVARFARLDEHERFRALVLLCKQPGVAVSIGLRGAWKFHPAHDAPADAVTLGEREHEAVARALERTG